MLIPHSTRVQRLSDLRAYEEKMRILTNNNRVIGNRGGWDGEMEKITCDADIEC